MKKESRIAQDDEIDLGKIIKTLWNEKILILSISLFFMVAGYVYGAFQPKVYKTEIVLREAPSSSFEAYRLFFATQQQQQIIAKQFNDTLKLDLLSIDTLIEFVENNNKINDFKNHLKEKNISVEKYFQPNLGTRKLESVIVDRRNNNKNKYSLTYSKILPGQNFLNDYVIFAQQKTITMFKQQLIQMIITEINIHQHHLEIAKKIDLENPILQPTIEGRSAVNEQEALFYKGTKVLTQQISYLNKLLNEVKNLTLDYNPILEQASSGSLITKSPIIYASITLLLGLFFSFLFILFSNLLKKERIR